MADEFTLDAPKARPLSEYPAEVLPAEGAHHATPDEVLGQLGKRPSTKHHPHIAPRSLSQA